MSAGAHAGRRGRETSRAALVVLVVLISVSTAAADVQPVPAGFTPNVALSRAASFVAGKPVTDYCAATIEQFNTAAIAATGWENPNGSGYSYVGGTQSFFAPWVCSALNRWNAHKVIDLRSFGAAQLALVHESELLSGVSDESVADCKGLAVMPKVIAKFFPLKKRATWHDVMGWAWSAHDDQPEQYLENCPQR